MLPIITGHFTYGIQSAIIRLVIKPEAESANGK